MSDIVITLLRKKLLRTPRIRKSEFANCLYGTEICNSTQRRKKKKTVDQYEMRYRVLRVCANIYSTELIIRSIVCTECKLFSPMILARFAINLPPVV